MVLCMVLTKPGMLSLLLLLAQSSTEPCVVPSHLLHGWGSGRNWRSAVGTYCQIPSETLWTGDADGAQIIGAEEADGRMPLFGVPIVVPKPSRPHRHIVVYHRLIASLANPLCEKIAYCCRLFKTGGSTFMGMVGLLRIRNDFHVIDVRAMLADQHLWRHLPYHAVNQEEVETCNTSRALIAHRISEKIHATIDQVCGATPNCAVLIHGAISLRAFDPKPNTRVDRIALVREPISRAISAYTHLRRHYQPNETQSADVSQLSLPAFPLDACVKNRVCKQQLARHCRTQLDALCGSDAEACLRGALSRHCKQS